MTGAQSSQRSITTLLAAAREGRGGVFNVLFEQVYAELVRCARGQRRRW